MIFKVYRFGAAVLIGCAGLSGQALQAEEDAFVGFKRNGVDTECTVPRLGDFPSYGDTMIGEDGGAKLNDEEAETVYQCILRDLSEAYARSGIPAAQNYLEWTRFSTLPYRSKGHENRYLNNYANDIAAEDYGQYGAKLPLPVGSILAKDSFVSNKGGRIVLGALTLMEKMPPGFAPENGDWKFTMILPDGRIMGMSGEDDEVAIEFCAECHHKSKKDFLFFMPKKYRVGADDSAAESGGGYNYNSDRY